MRCRFGHTLTDSRASLSQAGWFIILRVFKNLSPSQIEELAKGVINAGNLALGGYSFIPFAVESVEKWLFVLLGFAVWGNFYLIAARLFEWATERKNLKLEG